MPKKKTAKEQTAKEQTAKENEPPKRSRKGRVLAFIIYPDNPDQMAFFDWCKRKEKILFIHHDPEPKANFNNADSNLEDIDHMCKEHYHVMILFPNPRTVNGFLKSSAGCLTHAEIVSDRMAYYRYMSHDTYSCLKTGKKQYSEKDISYTDIDFLHSCKSSENCESDAYMISHVCDLIDCYCITSLVDLMHLLRDVHAENKIVSFVCRKTYFFVTYIKDIAKGKYKKPEPIEEIETEMSTPDDRKPIPAVQFKISKDGASISLFVKSSDYVEFLDKIEKFGAFRRGFFLSIESHYHVFSRDYSISNRVRSFECFVKGNS